MEIKIDDEFIDDVDEVGRLASRLGGGGVVDHAPDLIETLASLVAILATEAQRQRAEIDRLNLEMAVIKEHERRQLGLDD
jgi:hypothetical protein